MKHFLTYLDKLEPVTDVAKRLSKNDSIIWYCMTHPRRCDVCVSKNDVERYLNLGYTITCSYCNGNRRDADFGL